MNIKLLTIISIVVLGVGIYLYTKDDNAPTTAPLPTPKVNAEVTGIKAVKTNADTGEVEYILTADSLVQNAQTGQDELKNAVMDWTPVTGEHYTITSSIATFEQKTGELIMRGGFKLTKKPHANSHELIMTGTQLQGNTNTRLISSHAPLNVIQNGHHFQTKTMQGNLTTGEYEFGQIAIEFKAPIRQDTPLF